MQQYDEKEEKTDVIIYTANKIMAMIFIQIARRSACETKFHNWNAIRRHGR